MKANDGSPWIVARLASLAISVIRPFVYLAPLPIALKVSKSAHRAHRRLHRNHQLYLCPFKRGQLSICSCHRKHLGGRVLHFKFESAGPHQSLDHSLLGSSSNHHNHCQRTRQDRVLIRLHHHCDQQCFHSYRIEIY